MTKREEKKGERCLCLPVLGCLATYVDYVPYVSLPRLGGDTTPPQYSASKLGYGKELWTFIDTAIVEPFQPKCRLGDAK
jgi:hypothetical protein